MALDIGEFSPTSKPRPKEGVTFTLAGQRFTTIPKAPAAILNDLLAGIDIDNTGKRIFKAPNLIRFMQGVLRDEEPLTVEEAEERGVNRPSDADGFVWVPTDDVERFTDVVYGKRHIVEIEELGELVIKIGEALGDRPFPQSGRSVPGR